MTLLNIACMGTTGVPVFTSNCVFPNAACIALGCGESFGVPLTVSNKFQEHSAVAAWLCAIPCDHVVYERQYATETAVRARSVFVSHAHKHIHLSYGLLPREIQCLYRKHKNGAANVPVSKTSLRPSSRGGDAIQSPCSAAAIVELGQYAWAPGRACRECKPCVLLIRCIPS